MTVKYACFVFLFGLTACMRDTPSDTTTSDSFKFLACNEKTGSLAYLGGSVEKGMQLAVEHVNLGGGLAGRSLQLIRADTHSDSAAAAVEAAFYYQQNEPTMLGIVGAVRNDVSEGLLKLANNDRVYGAKIPIISPGSSSPAFSELLDPNGLFFRTVPPSNKAAAIFAERAAERGFHTGAVVAFRDLPGQRLAETFRQAFSGVVSSYYYQSVTFAEIDAALTQALATKPEFLLLAGYGDDSKIVLSEWAKRAPSVPLFLTEALMANSFLASLDPATLKALDAANVEGIYSSGDGEGYERFVAGFCALEPTECRCPPDVGTCDLTRVGRTQDYVANAYDAVMMMALAYELLSVRSPSAMDRANGWDFREISSAVSEVTNNDTGTDVRIYPNQWLEAREAIGRGEPIDYEGASARTLELDGNGDPTAGTYRFWTVRNGLVVETDSSGEERLVEVVF